MARLFAHAGHLIRAGPKVPAQRPKAGENSWVAMLDVEPTTFEKYKYLVEQHILPQFHGRELDSLTFEEIEAWERAIPTRISAHGRPFAQRTAKDARDTLITILGDAVHAEKIDRNSAIRRRGRRAGYEHADGGLQRTSLSRSRPT